MEQLILFRNLADLLSQNEFDLFMKASNLDIRSIILKELFSLFDAQIQNGRNSADLTETIQIISKIIESRNPTELSTELSLNDLPSALIGECASFLPFIDYNSLQNVSRSVFIGCNNPNTVTTIDRGMFSRNYKSKQHLQLVKYKKVINFEINMQYFLEMTLLRNLSLSQDTKSLLLYDCNAKTIKTFLKMKCLNFDKIEIFTLQQYESDGHDHDINTFCNLLKCFKNIKYLGFVYCFFVGIGFNKCFENDQFRKKIFNNLQGLALDRDPYNYQWTYYEKYNLLHYFSDKLLSFHFSHNITFPKNGFINLAEVCICKADHNKINNIIKTAKQLERVHLEFGSYNIPNDNELEDILLELLSQNTLEFVSIAMDNASVKIKNVLQKISFSKRKRFKLRFEITANINNANEYFDILENKLSEDGVFDDWMLIFIFRFIEAMRKQFTGKEAHHIGDRVQLVRTSKECKINGWREKWLYHCRHCNI